MAQPKAIVTMQSTLKNRRKKASLHNDCFRSIYMAEAEKISFALLCQGTEFAERDE